MAISLFDVSVTNFLQVLNAVDNFPRMVDYKVPAGVRIGDASRVRLGAHLASGTTVMHEGFVNFNAGTLGESMVEGRISAGVVVGNGSDIGGGAGIPPLPRKSALKQNSGNMILLHKSPSSGGTNSFHAHLPPPEFADLPSPPPSISNLSHGSGGPHSRSSSHEMVGIGSSSDHQPLIMPSSSREGIQRDMDRSSFRTLPRQLRTTASGTTICPTSSPNPPPQQQHAHHNPMLVQHGQSATTPTNISSQAGSVVGPSCNIQLHHQTLPLKSNLKKPSGGSGGGSSNNSAPSSSANNTNAQQKLQWNQTSTSRSSLEELRV